MSLALLFPGQGSQVVGMGAALAEAFASARLVFEEVDDALGQKLSLLMREGPESDLTLTENAQPALMAVSLRAVPVGEGAMASLIGPKADVALAEAAAAAGSALGVCVVANDNNAGNVVISGAKAAMDRAIEKAKELGARAIPLNVSAPFHSPLMQPAAEEMAEALAGTLITAPRAPLVANVTARPTLDPELIRSLLVQQVTGRVRWRESIAWLAEDGGVTRFAELGSGKVLTGIAKRIAPDAEAVALNTPQDLELFAKSL